MLSKFRNVKILEINEMKNEVQENDDLKSIEFLKIKTNKGFFLLACIELENNINEINILNKEETFKKLIGKKIEKVKGDLTEKENEYEIKTTTNFTFTTEEKEEIKLSIEYKNKNTLGSINRDILKVFISFTALEDLF
ncbi:hypothetical protein [Fusobacterium polymorphum]|uniref:Uncharacterized protein n=1 Tax=Fusobacterium nucleatum subsp. polymorphum TaxID=76857 RepID=A0A2C6BQX5_FUSNP|nr:hypothetical protein [Fusobacterium polymorphum]PHI06623.1 hypothetical protein CBG54_06030 [Fusobacterium polymorphum]